jgi:hypothetical protein
MMAFPVEIGASPATRREYVRLPDHITTGRYDFKGRPDPDGHLFITTRGTAFVWAVFPDPLLAGQEGEMIFVNLPGTFLLGVSFNEWNPALDEPTVSDALFTLTTAERGRGVARVVGRNTHDADLRGAVGIVVADNAAYA